MRLVKINEITEIIGVSAGTFRRWCREGLSGSYPPARRLGGQWLVDRDRLLGWISDVGFVAGTPLEAPRRDSDATRELIDQIIKDEERRL